MARSTAEIKAAMIAEKALQTSLAGLTSTSTTAIWNLYFFIVAQAINIFEQLQDVFKTEIEGIAAAAVPATPPWIQQKVFEFQYDAATPQVITLVDFVPTYATVDTTKRIVTRCSVKTNANKTVNVKVAKGTTPGPLAGAEQTALEAMLDAILPAGVQRSVINLTSDKLWIDGDIYYNGQYSATISADVIAAIKAYLADLPFDGVVKISSIEDAIQSVAGVTDVVITEVRARANTTAFGSASTIARTWDTVAGYIVEETTAGQTFTDTLTFTVANN